MHHVRLTTVAPLIGVKVHWLRGLIGQRVMDDERDNPAKGSPHLMHLRQISQAIIAQRLRRRNVGYDVIRAAVDDFEVFGRQYHVIPVADGIDLRLHRRVLMSESTEILRQANLIEYGTDEEEAAA